MTEGEIVAGATIASAVFAALLLIAVFRLRPKIARAICGVLSILALVITGGLFWYSHRPLPSPTGQRLFQGIDYIREVRAEPRPVIIHVVRIDLDAPGIRFFVTPGGEDIPARTVSQFLDEFDLQLAINGDFFDPWHDFFPWDYYPHVGDPVNARGLAASEGEVFTDGYAATYDTLYISAENRVSFDTSIGDPYNAISGNQLLIINGVRQVLQGVSSYSDGLHPRTAVGLDALEQTLIMMLVDGRQPNYSEGVSLAELSDLLLEYGAYHAINLDGGGSTTLVVEGNDGNPVVLNSPIHSRIPGRERPIANQLGVYAAPSSNGSCRRSGLQLPSVS